MGFEDLYYYGVDEPNQPAQIERCRKEAERRRAAGLHMMTAVNSTKAQEATRDWIDRPVYNIYVFGGPDSPHEIGRTEVSFRNGRSSVRVTYRWFDETSEQTFE
jgi:hypothetical protein